MQIRMSASAESPPKVTFFHHPTIHRDERYWGATTLEPQLARLQFNTSNIFPTQIFAKHFERELTGIVLANSTEALHLIYTRWRLAGRLPSRLLQNTIHVGGLKTLPALACKPTTRLMGGQAYSFNIEGKRNMEAVCLEDMSSGTKASYILHVAC
jgi:hypothetical protein